MLGHCLKKRGRGLDRGIVLDPLVDPGNPPHRHEACPAADPARSCPRMVVVAQGPSGQRARGSSQAKIATVMLKPHYDFIDCGSGSSGSVGARRLAENAEVSVLLLETGGSDDMPSIKEAGQWPLNLGSE